MLKRTVAWCLAMLFLLAGTQAFATGGSAQEEKPTLIGLRQELSRAVQAMKGRDRSADTPIFQIDAQRYVSQEDIDTLQGVLSIRYQLQMLKIDGSSDTEAVKQAAREALREPSNESTRELLVGELLLEAEAKALGVEVTREDIMRYMKEGWLDPDPPADSQDPAALVWRGMMRWQLWYGDLMNAEESLLPYQDSVPQIQALIETLKGKYTQPSIPVAMEEAAPRGETAIRALPETPLPHRPDHGYWVPRRLEPELPKGLLNGRKALIGKGVAPSFTMGASVVMQPERSGYLEDTDAGSVFHAFYSDTEGVEWELLDKYPATSEISNVVMQETGIAYLVGVTAYTSTDTCTLELVPANGEAQSLILGPTRRDRAPFVGPMLSTNDGVLIFADTLGKLYTCTVTDGLLDKVSDVTVQEFVWHEGFIYFTNMQDQVTYKNVYCEEMDEHLDIAYPRLYRMRIDGSEMARLTECGVKGLVAQGQYIVYQNLDDPFALGMRIIPEPWDWLNGALWLLDADTGKHHPLHIEAESYAATPHGLAVFYTTPSGDAGEHEELVLTGAALFGFDGEPLHKLDIPREYRDAPFAVTNEALVFWSANYDRLSVPLDGSPYIDKF